MACPRVDGSSLALGVTISAPRIRGLPSALALARLGRLASAVPMNILLWILQLLLALLYLAGGAYKAFSFAEVASHLQALPHGAWRALGVLEMIGGVLLVVPAAFKLKPELTPLAAAVLAVETFAITLVYAQYSLQITPQNPLVWSLVMGVLVAFVAYGRYRIRPIG